MTPLTDPSATGVGSPANLVRSLRDEHALYRRLELLSERQHDLISRDDPRELLKVLAERESVTSELTALGRRLAPLRRAWPAMRGQLTIEQREEADRLIQASSQVANKVLSRDAEDTQRLALRKRVTAQSAESSAASRTALHAYSHAQRDSGGKGSWQG